MHAGHLFCNFCHVFVQIRVNADLIEYLRNCDLLFCCQRNPTQHILRDVLNGPTYPATLILFDLEMCHFCCDWWRSRNRIFNQQEPKTQMFRNEPLNFCTVQSEVAAPDLSPGNLMKENQHERDWKRNRCVV